jgi:hypothetical protein
MASPSDRYVCLGRGLTLPLEPVLLVLDLEARNITITRNGEDRLTVRPAASLTDEDRAALHRWKPHILAMVNYCDNPFPEVM